MVRKVQYLALDTETTGINLHTGDQPFYISTCDWNGRTKCWRFRVDPWTRNVSISHEQRTEIEAYISKYTVVFHNAKFDVRALATLGITFHWSFEETLLASHAISSSDRHGLKELALKYLDYPDTDERKLKAKVIRARGRAKKLGWKIHEEHTEADYWIPGQLDPKDKCLEEYATQDAERTMLLWKLYQPLLDKLSLRKGYEEEKKLLRVVYKMENEGVTINTRKLDEIKSFLLQETEEAEKEGKSILKSINYPEINLDSGQQLVNILHGKKYFNLPVVKNTEKGGISTDKDALKELYKLSTDGTPEQAFIQKLLFKRALQSGIRYLTGYQGLAYKITDDWSILFPSLNQTGTKTTRFSSSNPNGQNISKKNKAKIPGEEDFEIPKLREVFGPAPGKVWYAIDYSQLELRVFAAVSNEQSMIDALNAGYDFHGYVASRIFNKPMDQITDMERTIAKNTNFALIFGASPRKVNETAGIPNAYELFAGQFPYATDFMQKTIREVRKTGYVRTVDGYRLDIPLNAPYKAVNYLVQGTAGRIIKRAMVKIDKEDWFDWESIRLVLQIHDELIVETDTLSEYNSPHYIHRIMELMKESGQDMGINTPADCDIITSDWGHGQLIKVTPTEMTLAA